MDDQTLFIGPPRAWWLRRLRLRGLSRHQAAARFGIAASTAVHWVRPSRHGQPGSSKIGGYKLKTLRGEHVGLADRAVPREGLHFEAAGRGAGPGARPEGRHSLGVEFVHAEGLSFKSVFANEQDRPDVARRREQWRKYQDRIDPKRLVLSMRPGPRRTWRPAARLGSSRRTGEGHAPPLEDHDLHRRAAARPDRRALPLRRTDQRPDLLRLRPRRADPDARRRRRGDHGQPRQPSRKDRSARHPRCRSQAAVPARNTST